MIRGIFGPGTVVLGGGALLMIAFLAVGFFLPGTWEATVEVTLAASADELAPYLESPRGWRAWTTWPDSVAAEGPARGPGAAMSWDDPQLGTGTFRIDGVDRDGGVRYSVAVEGVGGGVMETSGSIALVSARDSTLVRWREEGDLGGNPLMGYWALSMKRAQSGEMRKSLDRLVEVASGGATLSPAPTR